MGTEKGVKLDQGKIRLDLVPPELMEEVGKVLTFGAEKYTENGWQSVENPKNRYYAAAMRHLLAHKKGEKTDPESGLSHLSHAATNICFLLWFEVEEERDKKLPF